MSTGQAHQQSSRRYGYILSVLFMLFCLRVLAQLIQVVYPLSFLPAFHVWQSGALPYWVLMMAQILIMVFCASVIMDCFKGTMIPSLRKGKIYLLFGVIYFSIMILRLLAGLTVAQDHFWLSARLPTVFHLVLATFVLVYGHLHFRHGHSSKASAIVTS